MCLLVVLSRVVPGWPLVVAANRDELFARPASPFGVLREEPLALGHRDLVAGGTALAVSRDGVVAGLTNRPGGSDPAKRSRGEIPLGLTELPSATAAAERFVARHPPATYSQCWVLTGDRDALLLLDLTTPEAARAQALEPGIHVLENAPLGSGTPKAELVRAKVGDPRDLDGALTTLRALLADHEQADPAFAHPPVSAACVHTESYGTRSATLVAVPEDPAAAPEVWASDGPSCTHPLTRRSWPGG